MLQPLLKPLNEDNGPNENDMDHNEILEERNPKEKT